MLIFTKLLNYPPLVRQSALLWLFWLCSSYPTRLFLSFSSLIRLFFPWRSSSGPTRLRQLFSGLLDDSSLIRLFCSGYSLSFSLTNLIWLPSSVLIELQRLDHSAPTILHCSDMTPFLHYYFQPQFQAVAAMVATAGRGVWRSSASCLKIRFTRHGTLPTSKENRWWWPNLDVNLHRKYQE
jgi:hypothetical protein